MMATLTAYGGAVFVALTFIALLKLFKLFETAPQVTAISALAFRDLRDPQLDDEGKEARMRAHTRTLAILFTRLTAGTLAAVGAPLAVVGLMDAAGLMSLSGVLEALSSWPLMAAGMLVVAVQIRLVKGPGHAS